MYMMCPIAFALGEACCCVRDDDVIKTLARDDGVETQCYTGYSLTTSFA